MRVLLVGDYNIYEILLQNRKLVVKTYDQLHVIPAASRQGKIIVRQNY